MSFYGKWPRLPCSASRSPNGGRAKSARKVEFDGAMWGGDQNRQWTDPFRASMVDKTCTKQGIWVTIRVGDEQGEGELTETFRPWKTGACETQRL